MDIPTVIFGVVLVALCCLGPFVIYILVMFSLHQKIGNWYVERVQALNEKDLSIFALRNMFYPSLIFIMFLVALGVFIIWRPSFFDPNWFCFLFAGVQAIIIVFSAFQYAWLHYRTRNKK